MSHTLAEIATYIDAELYGDKHCLITGIASLTGAKEGTISFLSNRRYLQLLRKTRATAVILSREYLAECPSYSLVVDDPYLAYAFAAQLLYREPESLTGIHRTASVDESAKIDNSAYIGAQAVIEEDVEIGANVYVGAGAVIGRHTSIGKGSRILSNATICHSVRIGSRVLIHPGAVIGSDGFGLAEKTDSSWIKIPQVGTVIIEDDVEIGANTTIDRGALDDTVIKKGVKIDNQVQIGHNVSIGEHTAIAGCTGIAGSAIIGRRCRIGGGCGISGHLEIADDVILTAMSAVNNSIASSGVYSSPLSVTDNRTWRKNVARFHKLDASIRKLRQEIRKSKKEL